VKVYCKTNLDLRGERWPTKLPAIPRIGERIQSSTKWGVFQLSLEVRQVTWIMKQTYMQDGITECEYWIPEIELHIPRHRKWSIRDFYEWYAPLVGRSVSAFI